VIMVLFDAADPLLHLAKLFNYVKQAAGSKGPSLSFTWIMSQITDVILGCFAVVFIITRIFVYSYIVFSVSYESYQIMFCGDNDCDILEAYSAGSPAHHICVCLVWILNFLQWYWFKLLLVVIYRSVFLGETDDARSDLSQDEDGEVKHKADLPPKNKAKFVPIGVDGDPTDDKKTK
jgi:TLC domain